MRNEILYLSLVMAAGFVLGVLFYGGLWLTVRKALLYENPGMLFILSALLRVGVVLVGIYFIALSDWKRFVVCMLGFAVARYAVIHFTKPDKQLKQKVCNET